MSRFVVGELLLAAMIVSVATAARALRRELLPGVDGPPAWVADVVIALTTVVVVSEILGTFGWFRAVPLAACVIAVSAGGWAVLRRRTARGTAKSAPAPRPNRAVYWVGLGGSAVVMAQWGSGAATPLNTGITDYDSLNYHLTLAARFVQTGSIAPLHYVSPDSPVHLYPQNSEVLHAVGMAVLHSDVASVFLNLGWLAFAIMCGWAIGRRFALGPLAGLAVAAVMALPVMAATQAGTAGNDAAALALFLASLAIFVNTPAAAGPRFACGLAAGLAIGTKLTVIAPCLLLGAAVLVMSGQGTRGRAFGAWVGGAALTGSYFYVRNLVVTGSPDPAVHLAVGSVGFPYAHFRLIDYFGFSVAHYWNRPHVWRTMLIPGLSSLGDAWPGLLAVVAAGAAYALFRRSGLARLLAVITIISAAVYVVTPTTAIGYDGGPSLYAQNLRYLTPALATGLILVALFAPGQRYRWQLAVTGLIAAILVVTLLPGTWSPWPTTTKYPKATVFLALASGALLIAGARLPSLRSRLNRPRALVALLAGTCLAVAGGALLNHRFQARRYVAGDALYTWVQHNLRHARIAIAGLDRQYPLYGSDWSNYVQYVGTRQPHAGFTVASDCRAWEASLAAGRFGYVVTRDDLVWPYVDGVPELGWTALTPGMRLVFIGAGATILHLTRPPSAGLCPPGSKSSAATAPRHPHRLGSPAA